MQILDLLIIKISHTAGSTRKYQKLQNARCELSETAHIHKNSNAQTKFQILAMKDSMYQPLNASESLAMEVILAEAVAVAVSAATGSNIAAKLFNNISRE